MNTILLTGTIDTSKFNNSMTTLSDLQTRLSHYDSAIKKWIKKTDFQKIIFIENSGYKFDDKPYVELAKKYGKQFEYILATAYVDETIKYGKSYGEIKIMNEAVEKSKLLKDEDSFYKCTGRLFIKNANSILKEKHNKKSVFQGVPSDKWVFTWFFEVEKDFYLSVLSDAYKEVNDYKDIYMENIYYKRLIKNRDKIETFNQYPNVFGISAGNNNKFHTNFVSQFLKNRKIKNGFFGVK